MSSRPVLLLAVATCALAAGPAAPTAAAPVAAAATGACTDDRGVTVVADFGVLGGGTVVRCAADLPGEATGLDALRAAGLAPEGVRRWGDAFVCRLLGQPASDRPLLIPGNEGYREQCLDTPPPGAYWSYWSAAPGGSWAYSQSGARTRRVSVGGFEGWSFVLGGGSARPPAVAPQRPTAPTAEPTPGTGADRTAAARRDRPTAPAESTSADRRTPRASVVPTKGGTPADTPGSRTPTSTGTPPGTSATQPEAAPTTAATSVSTASAAPSSGGGPSSGALAGAGLLAFLVTAGLTTAWRRRRAP